jgi:hypothetical protein
MPNLKPNHQIDSLQLGKDMLQWQRNQTHKAPSVLDIHSRTIQILVDKRLCAVFVMIACASPGASFQRLAKVSAIRFFPGDLVMQVIEVFLGASQLPVARRARRQARFAVWRQSGSQPAAATAQSGVEYGAGHSSDRARPERNLLATEQ